ncbi:MAG: aminotransferase class I/II-fold pyridoxal phosphate-dependent enzyme [Candidatus Peregrinibacteria bacterium]
MPFPVSDPLQNTAPYAFAEVDKLVSQLKEQGVTPIDFGVGDPTEPTPEFIREALKKGADIHATAGYPSYIGHKKFLEAAAGYMERRFGVELDPATEITSNIGAKEAVFHFSFGHLNAGDLVIIPTPGYPPMRTGTRFCRAEIYSVGLFEENDFLIDYKNIPEDIADRAKILWLNYPNSPTGKTASLEWYRGLVEWAQKHNIILACDEGCYIDIYFHGEKPHSILEVTKKGVICFYSLSKRNNMTGYRVGFLCGDSELIATFKKVKTNIDSGTPNFVQEAAIAALQNDDHVETMRQAYQKKQDILLSALEKAGLPKAKIDATFYIWQKAPAGMTGVELAKKLLSPEIGIVTTPGAWISEEDTRTGKNPGENYIRFALVASLAEVEEAAKRLEGLRL